MCIVSGNENPDCFNCIIYKTFDAHDKTIKELKKEVSIYKDKSDKYDEIAKAYADQVLKIVAKAFINTLSDNK